MYYEEKKKIYQKFPASPRQYNVYSVSQKNKQLESIQAINMKKMVITCIIDIIVNNRFIVCGHLKILNCLSSPIDCPSNAGNGLKVKPTATTKSHLQWFINNTPYLMIWVLISLLNWWSHLLRGIKKKKGHRCWTQKLMISKNLKNKFSLILLLFLYLFSKQIHTINDWKLLCLM